MASPSSFCTSPHFLRFLNQEIRALCYTRSPPYPRGISCPIIHLPWFTPLGVSASQDSSSLNEPWLRCARPMSWMDSPSIWATTGRMFLQFVTAFC